jgi:molybdopterin-containing oxidoreductase family iron-sulfur binding subunit
MAVDLEKCVACSACVAACYVENNVPMTGREEHLKGREMSWIRIEPYYTEDGSRADFVPTMCQQCDYAPCEPVCPVYAAHHNDEGLNVQVYNRCVGTRYCSNNCPYKQRRFNWFPHDHRPHPLNLMVNPDVSLRGKGIMEKCTFCVQRIRKARDVAKDEKRGIREGDLTTACAQSCPGNAIVFGNLLDESSQVYQWAHDERSTTLLEELGVGPAVFYLKKVGSHDA